MREIGRLREIAFRTAGGGTGYEVDIDHFDTMDTPCEQLIVWNPEAQEIIGGYRFILGEDIKYDAEGQPLIATSHLFKFSKRFIDKYMPYTIELGRSFVAVEYQSSQAGAKSLYALDNLWDGLGALTIRHPQIKYFFGKFTMYPTFNKTGRDMILFYLKRHFGDKQKLVTPHNPLKFASKLTLLQRLFPAKAVKENYKIRQIAGENLVISQGRGVADMTKVISLNQSAVKLWEALAGREFSEDDAAEVLVSLYGIEKERALTDAKAWIEKLQSCQVIA